MTVVERRLIVTEEAGLHARPAAAFAQTAARSEAEVTVAREDGREVPARSVLSLMTLNIRCGDAIVLRASGADAESTLDELARIAAPA
ncbi:HPr family phosphocarrier protein [Streptomyces kunmingensis]|uniref:Phosphocarrier protein HPr n=1 Tax=Streptomyces kunmingensis TaxID=68225 RepID=A0ABU6CI04_9ACTN|nr:HPr family phosphocarrier protein [Streptomyces kunmingensis]MEB3964360.1 HPr family phosphocarrier protein [Streptomyces kunmingensis]